MIEIFVNKLVDIFFVFLRGRFAMNYERTFRTIYQQVDGSGPLQPIRTGEGVRRFPPDVEQHCARPKGGVASAFTEDRIVVFASRRHHPENPKRLQNPSI